MKSILALIGLLAAVGYVAANEGTATIQEIENDFVNSVDGDSDGLVTSAELLAFLGVFDTDGDSQLTKHEFVTKWVNDFGDHHHESNLFFDRIDFDNNGWLDVIDLGIHFGAMDYNGDGMVTTEELRQWFRQTHPNGHLNG